MGPRFGISVEAIEAGDEYFDRRGPATIIFARFVAVMKNLAPTIAGASRLKLWVFEVYSLIGAVLYAGILVALGWFLGENFSQGLKYFGAFSWVMFIVVIVVIIVIWQGKRRRDKRVVKREAARFEAEHGRIDSEECDDLAAGLDGDSRRCHGRERGSMSTREAVLAALREAGRPGLSGEALAQTLGVSRVAVGKHIAALREAGYEIAAEPGVGYRLIAAPDGPLPAEIAPLLRRCCMDGAHRRRRDRLDERRRPARSRARARPRARSCSRLVRAPAGAGSGARGHRRLGGVYLSVVLRPSVTPAELAPLALVVGLGIARGLSEHLGVEAVAQVAQRRAARVRQARRRAARDGRRDRPRGLGGRGRGAERAPGRATCPRRHRAACLDDVVPGVRIATAAPRCSRVSPGPTQQWAVSGFSALRAEYEARSLADRPRRDRSRHGRQPCRASGTVMGVDDEGRLLVATLGGLESVVAGEVTLREPGA